MPEHIRALIVILFIATVVFVVVRTPARQLIGRVDFERRRNAWYGMTLLAFLSNNFWVYAIISALWLITRARESRPVALFFMLLLVLPASHVQVPGFGSINYLLTMSHQRILALVLLLPASLVLMQRSGTQSFGRNLPDKLIGSYILLNTLLYFRDTSITDALRQAVYQFTDIFLPYFVISRSLKTLEDFRHAIASIVIGALIVAMIAAFETVRHWLLYSGVIGALGMDRAMTSYLGRAGMLRAIASTGHAIALGYFMAVSMGLYLYLQQSIRSRQQRLLWLAILAVGLIASLSRGPWVGMVFVAAVFVATGRRAFSRLAMISFSGTFAILILAALPGGETVINLLPFIGETERENITYRQQLLDNALIVIQRNPWLGTTTYLETPEMEAMRQGQGIIDIVNSYVGIALETGIVGLSLFVGFFASICWGILWRVRHATRPDSEEHLLGRALLATLLGILLIIFTVSGISIIPVVYWSIAGMGAAYILSVKKVRLR